MFMDSCGHRQSGLVPGLLLWASLVWPLAAGAQDKAPGADGALQSLLRGLRVDALATSDSNVTRSNQPAQRVSDHSLGLMLNLTRLYPSTPNSRFVVNGFAGLEHWNRFHGLGKVYAGADVEWQYRTSAAFDASTLGIKLGGTAENFQSALRDGHRISLEASWKRSLTDRIDTFAAVRRNARKASSAVFETRDTAVQLNLDYALSSKGTLYTGAEYRQGDFVSSGLPALSNLNLAKVLVVDDALRSVGYNSYRIDGRSKLFTAGYNHALSSKQSLDLSWRHIRSDPSASPGVPVNGPSHYRTDQISLVYLRGF